MTTQRGVLPRDRAASDNAPTAFGGGTSATVRAGGGASMSSSASASGAFRGAARQSAPVATSAGRQAQQVYTKTQTPPGIPVRHSVPSAATTGLGGSGITSGVNRQRLMELRASIAKTSSVGGARRYPGYNKPLAEGPEAHKAREAMIEELHRCGQQHMARRKANEGRPASEAPSARSNITQMPTRPLVLDAEVFLKEVGHLPDFVKVVSDENSPRSPKDDSLTAQALMGSKAPVPNGSVTAAIVTATPTTTPAVIGGGGNSVALEAAAVGIRTAPVDATYRLVEAVKNMQNEITSNRQKIVTLETDLASQQQQRGGVVGLSTAPAGTIDLATHEATVAEVRELRGTVSVLTQERDVAKSQASKLDGEVHSVRQQYKDALLKVKELEALRLREIREKEAKIAQLVTMERLQHGPAEPSKETLQDLEDAKKQCDTLRQQLFRSNAEKRDLVDQLQSTQSKLQHEQAVIASHAKDWKVFGENKTKLASLVEENQQLKDRIKSHESIRSRLEQQVNSLKADSAILRNKLSAPSSSLPAQSPTDMKTPKSAVVANAPQNAGVSAADAQVRSTSDAAAPTADGGQTSNSPDLLYTWFQDLALDKTPKSTLSATAGSLRTRNANSAAKNGLPGDKTPVSTAPMDTSLLLPSSMVSRTHSAAPATETKASTFDVTSKHTGNTADNPAAVRQSSAAGTPKFSSEAAAFRLSSSAAASATPKSTGGVASGSVPLGTYFQLNSAAATPKSTSGVVAGAAPTGPMFQMKSAVATPKSANGMANVAVPTCAVFPVKSAAATPKSSSGVVASNAAFQKPSTAETPKSGVVPTSAHDVQSSAMPVSTTAVKVDSGTIIPKPMSGAPGHILNNEGTPVSAKSIRTPLSLKRGDGGSRGFAMPPSALASKNATGPATTATTPTTSIPPRTDRVPETVPSALQPASRTGTLPSSAFSGNTKGSVLTAAQLFADKTSPLSSSVFAPGSRSGGAPLSTVPLFPQASVSAGKGLDSSATSRNLFPSAAAVPSKTAFKTADHLF